VANPALVDAAGLHALGAFGVVISGHIVQVVIGTGAVALAAGIEAELRRSPQSAGRHGAEGRAAQVLERLTEQGIKGETEVEVGRRAERAAESDQLAPA
jgi:hypothetical protein